MAIAHRNIPYAARMVPDREIQGHGSMRYTPYGSTGGRLNRRLRDLYGNVYDRNGSVPTIYSYSTPIAWFDREYGVWVIPAVSYSASTAKQQSYLYQLGCGQYPTVSVPYDCGWEEYFRYVSGLMRFERWGRSPALPLGRMGSSVGLVSPTH